MKNTQTMLPKGKSPLPSTPQSQEEEMTGLETENIMQKHLDQMFKNLEAKRKAQKG